MQLLQVTGTRSWLRSLKLPVVRSWRPWRSDTGQIGGYFEHYKGLTFVTVRDAGHMVCALLSLHRTLLCAFTHSLLEQVSIFGHKISVLRGCLEVQSN